MKNTKTFYRLEGKSDDFPDWIPYVDLIDKDAALIQMDHQVRIATKVVFRVVETTITKHVIAVSTIPA